MKRALALLLLLGGCSAAPSEPDRSPAAGSSPSITLPAENPAPGDHETAFRDGQGTVHRYLVHAPASYSQSKPLPLVLVFHGIPGAAETLPPLTKMNEVADAHGFLVVYPRDMADTAAAAALIEHLIPKWNVDPKRVHATGFSRGGSFVYELAEKLPERFGSVAPVSASGGTGTALAKPPSLITFQGSQDRLRQAWSSTNANWTKSAGCSGETVKSITMQGGPTHIYTTTCTGGAEHVVYSVTSMGHEWPADASKLIWEFFGRHPLP